METRRHGDPDIEDPVAKHRPPTCGILDHYFSWSSL
jgi:hypothetical protein